MTLWRALKSLLMVMLVLCVAWAGGFVWFVAVVSSYKEPLIDEVLQTTDAVVVLTGGSERLSTGLNLLRAGKAKKLLITGVHPGVTLSALLKKEEQTDPALRDCCIVLGHEADNTYGNALETATFLKAEAYRSIRLVTANYHMPRSALLFSAQMPDIHIVPHPVLPDSINLSSLMEHPKTIALLAGEYTKLSYAWVRIIGDMVYE